MPFRGLEEGHIHSGDKYLLRTNNGLSIRKILKVPDGVSSFHYTDNEKGSGSLSNRP